MEQISLALLNSALTAPSELLQRRLSEEEYATLSVLVAQMAQRYPSQDLEQSIEGYLADFERLALRCSLQRVRDALAALRIKPGQKFFPRPDEVAEEIEEQRERRRFAHQREEQARRRQAEIAEFWRWAPGWMEATGHDEQELLIRWPSFRGTKPSVALENVA